MLWQEYIMSYHCPEYEGLTVEGKLLVDKEMRVWFKKFDGTCVPSFIFRIAEERITEKIIERIKEENDRRDREQSAS